MPREYDPNKTYRPHTEYCENCMPYMGEGSFNSSCLVFYYEPASRCCYKCGRKYKCIDISRKELDIIGRATSGNRHELERLVELKKVNLPGFNNEIDTMRKTIEKRWGNRSFSHIYKCSWCIKHNSGQPHRKTPYETYYYDNYYILDDSVSHKCPVCERDMDMPNIDISELGVIGRATNKDMSALNDMLKLKDTDINKYYWKLGAMEADYLGIRYPGDPIPIGEIAERMPHAIILLLKGIFFTWPHSILTWLIVLGILIAWGGGS